MPCVGRTLLSDAFDFSLCQSKRNINSDGQECPSHTGTKNPISPSVQKCSLLWWGGCRQITGESRGQALQEAVCPTQARNIVWRRCGNRNSRAQSDFRC